jgi:hypothetical protein
VTSALFTYYTTDLEEVFLDNVNSLIKNSDQKYDTIVICSMVSIPARISADLYRNHRVVRVYPDHRGKQMLDQLQRGDKFVLHPFFLTAIAYRGANIVTIFDSRLFVINRVPAFNGANLFYKTHTDQISPGLFTIRPTPELTDMLMTAFVATDFRDQLLTNRFSFMVANALAARPYSIVGDKFVFSNPSDSAQIRQDKLIALDFSNLDKSRPVYKHALAIKQATLPKITTLTKIKKAVKSSAKVIDRAISKIDMMLAPSLNYRILFKYTSRSRPDLFHRGLSSIFNNCESQNFMVLCSLDTDDETLPEYTAAIKQFPSSHIKAVYGTSKNKVDAINRDLNSYKGRWDIVVNMSDDMIFTEYGFDIVIRTAFGNDLDQFIHFNDGIQFANLCSMTIEGRPYYQRFNYIYSPTYTSLWCDSEAQEVAINLGKYKYMGDDMCILKHLHPSAGFAEFDDQYKKTEDRAIWAEDKRTYQIRKASGFKDPNPIKQAGYQPKLSILILTINSRIDQFASLLEEFNVQVNKYDGKCEILWELDNGERTTGEKRNSLLERATGEYVAFFDDDDWPAPNYVSSILSAIKSKPDCCSLLGEMTTDGTNPELFEHSLKYREWKTNPHSHIRYERNPNHLNAIKSSIAKQMKFPNITFGEDKAWSDLLAKSGLLKTESTIDTVIYYYRYITQK